LEKSSRGSESPPRTVKAEEEEEEEEERLIIIVMSYLVTAQYCNGFCIIFNIILHNNDIIYYHYTQTHTLINGVV